MGEVVEQFASNQLVFYERDDELEAIIPEIVLTDEIPDRLVNVVAHVTLSEFWCPYCGGWHGGGPPPRPEAAPAPPIPDVLKKVVGLETTVEGKWEYGGKVDDQPAKVRQTGRRIEALWGGTPKPNGDPWPDGPRHGHIISNDGTNATFVAEPGADRLARDIPVDDRRLDPYDTDQRPIRANYDIDKETGSYDFR